MQITFVSGWAGCAAQYSGLADSARFLIPFTGFSPEELPDLLNQGGDLLLGWSSGAHMLLRDCLHLFPAFRKVILLAPFASFTDSFPERLIRGMIAGMHRDPEQVVASFHANCGQEIDCPHAPDQVPALVGGLEYLITSGIEIPEQIVVDNLTLVHGNRDRIVRRRAFERVLDLVRPAAVEYPDCGHMIPERELIKLF